MRHGESKSQAKQIEKTAPDSINVLTDTGIEQVKKVASDFQDKIDAVYASPYVRTQLTAQLFLKHLNLDIPIITDNRLREIDYGIFGIEDKKNPEMIHVATEQIKGNYEIRFGRFGENKREIVTRFFNFLTDIFNKHSSDNSILAVTHGRAISIIAAEICMINNITIELASTKNAQIKEIELTEQTISNIIKHIEKINSN